MGRTIFVLLDGCQYVAGSRNLGYLEHMIDYLQGAKYKVRGELPSLSRPMYETLLTGLPVYQHGITNNDIVRNSCCENIFFLCKKSGLTTAAAAYFWISELYNHVPFCKETDRIQLSSSGLIDNGIYYWDDAYPDTHLFADGEFLWNSYKPDFLMLHSMAIDHSGHIGGSGSAKYETSIALVGHILATLLPIWINNRINVVITADHGINEFGIHGGTDSIQRDTPLYIFSEVVKKGRYDDKYISQLNIAPLLCKLLEMNLSKGMISQLEIREIENV